MKTGSSHGQDQYGVGEGPAAGIGGGSLRANAGAWEEMAKPNLVKVSMYEKG
jgi:hypothetical protein